MESARRWGVSWLRAMGAATVIVAILIAVLAIVPDRIASFVERRSTSSTIRDTVLTGWFVVSVAASAWALRWAQRRGII